MTIASGKGRTPRGPALPCVSPASLGVLGFTLQSERAAVRVVGRALQHPERFFSGDDTFFLKQVEEALHGVVRGNGTQIG